MSHFDFDFFVIGAGSGGTRAARIAAQHGAKTAIAEGDRFGGTCVIRGCVPKKLMVYASRFPHEFNLSRAFGWEPGTTHFDFATLMANTNAEVARLETIYRGNLEKAGVTAYAEFAEFDDAHTLRLSSGKIVTAKHILIATGGEPVRPDFTGNGMALVSDDIFNLTALPESLLIVGGGYIALEFASLFANLGSRVALLPRSGTLLRGFDEEMTAALIERLKRDINFLPNGHITTLEKAGQDIRAQFSNGGSHDATHVLLATGRRPKLDGLSLEKSGVALNEEGAIAVSAASQTNMPHIYAVGDVTDRVNLTPVAIREGHAVADSLFGEKPWHVDHDGLPSAAFTTPELAQVGLTEKHAREKVGSVRVYRSGFRPMREVMSPHGARVQLKLVVDGETDIVLGAQMLGEGAAEAIQLLAIALNMKATKRDLDRTMAVHPTVAEEWVTLR